MAPLDALARPRARSNASSASVSLPSSRRASPRTSARSGWSSRPATARRTSSANAGASRIATPSRSAARVASPRARAARPPAKASDAVDGAPAVSPARLRPRRRGAFSAGFSGSSGVTGQIVERGIPANSRSSGPPATSSARAERRRASPGRPTAATASVAITRASGDSLPRARSAAAASPAPARSPVRQRISARSRSPGSSSRPRPASASSSARASACWPPRR